MAGGISISGNPGAVISKTDLAFRVAAEVIGGTIESYAKNLCPVDTGNLRNSITHSTENGNTVVVGSAVEYAPYVELGHRQEPGRYVPAIGRRLVADHVAPRPYLRPALENHMDEYKKILLDELNRA